MSIKSRSFGETGGKRVDAFTLTSDTGVEVDIIGYGVAVRDWKVPVAGGAPRTVVLGFEDLPSYLTHSPHFGALAGRVANRIEGAGFTLDGKSYTLAANEHGNTLHGGREGLGLVVWSAEPDSAANAVRFTHFSPDGTMGFPGNIFFSATYTLEGNTLRLELAGLPDRRTPISVVQHQYFNLGTDVDVLDHQLTIDASARSEVDGHLIPTGTILPVAGTDHDFRQGRTLRRADNSPIDCDLNLVLDTGRDLARPLATVKGPDGALTLQLWSDQPAVQLYNSVYMPAQLAVPGLGGRRYGKYAGLCLEDQMYPGALHQAHFPSIIHSPDDPYYHWCEIEIG